MTDILMPRLTDQMEEATIVAWLAEDGESVSPGQEIVEFETDKATMPWAAEAAGILRTVASVGDTVRVGELIGRLGSEAETVSAAAAPDGPEAHPAEPMIADDPPAAADPPARGEPADPDGAGHGTGGPMATPLARRVAGVHRVDLGQVTGSGPAGRITKADVLRAAGLVVPVEPLSSPPPPPSVPPAAAVERPPGGRIQHPTRLQQVVARRMADAKATVPHFQVQTEVQIDAAVALRAELKASAAGRFVPSLNDLIVRACGGTLPDHPLVNGSFKDGVYELHDEVHVGIAVASEDGLVVVTVRDAGEKSLERVGRESRELAERVRAGTATAADLSGATFTVSNLGMFGMTAITPVINPPQAAILGVGAARPVLARLADGTVVDRQLLTLTLSCDHRILNGADGSRFLLDLKERLERPLALAL